MNKTAVERYVSDPRRMRLFQQERATYEVTELLEARMKELGVTRGDLAKRLGKTKGWVTELLDGNRDKTIRMIADAFAVLGDEYHSTCRPIEFSWH
jgi:antitoxin component HigA of HigAB toxin-antitoxin module